ncbi:MAG: DUF5009 domain-containing protein [Polyangiaceae bacterium]|nr:DUF5009 domain-containing protein [Polyangiaceae bacterium]
MSQDRKVSLDVFRGLTIIFMVFVNDLGTRGIPRWLQHAHANEDRMTVVDIVFPAFLFIVGMSMPLARQAAIKRGLSVSDRWRHALLRSLGLLLMGYFMVNRWSLDPKVAWLSAPVWTLGSLVAIFLIWNQWPQKTKLARQRAYLLQGLGGVLLLGLFGAFCGGKTDAIMQPQWWGILGLIGWAYLISFVLLELTSYSLTATFLAVAVLVAFRELELPLRNYLHSTQSWPALVSEWGILASMTLLGATVTKLILGKKDLARAYYQVIGMAGVLFAVGYGLRPLLGASKIRATPTWCLYSVAWCALAFLLIYWLVDVKKFRRWFRGAQRAGENPLTIYLLPSVFFSILALFQWSFFDDYFGAGLPRVLRSAALTMLFLWVARWGVRWGVRLKL